MDPNAALDAILEHLADLHQSDTGGETDPGYRENAVAELRNLADWLERDGFPPDAEAAVKRFALTLG